MDLLAPVGGPSRSDGTPAARALPSPAVPNVLVVSDADRIHQEVRSVVDGADATVREVRSGHAVLAAVKEHIPDLVVTDMQVGSMGAVAICLDLRLEESGGRVPHVPVLILLDRRPDVFLAKRADADGWVLKPLDPIRLRRAIDALLAGGNFFDESYRPPASIGGSGK